MEPVPGRRLVLVVYGVLVALAAGLGAVLGAVILPGRVDGPLPMAELGPITFPITPLSMALYGVVVVSLGFGGLLALVAYASRYDEAAGRRDYL